LKELSRATSWEARKGKEGKGVKSAMLILYVFFGGWQGFFGCENEAKSGKYKVGPKKSQ
jgi:hypothetical protein